MKKTILAAMLSGICSYAFAQPTTHFEIVAEQPLQVMEHFSASDAWSMHITGKTEPGGRLAIQHGERCQWET